MKRFNNSIGTKISLIAFAMILVSGTVIGAISYFLYRNETIHDYGVQAMMLAESLASGIDPEQFALLDESGVENEYYDGLYAFFSEVKTRTDVEYAYALNNDVDGRIKYIVEGAKAGEFAGDGNVGFLGEVEAAGTFGDETYETLDTGEPMSSGIYTSGDFGQMVSGYAPVKAADGKVIGVVGVDIGANEVAANSTRFGMQIAAIVALFCISFGLLFRWYSNKNVGKPILELAEASQAIAVGDTNVHLSFKSNDEIGRLTDSFNEMVKSTIQQSDMFEAVADGDLTIHPRPRSERDRMGYSMMKMVDNLNRTISSISTGANEVHRGSQQVADGANSLAHGSIKQASSVEELSNTMTSIAMKAQDNAKLAEQASDLAGDIMEKATLGSTQMDNMIEAVNAINESSEQINNVIGVIENIAFQTNILALNASVEAARAGVHGKGFAVVAEEVRALAGQSSSAASDTNRMITDSIEKAGFGARIARDTAESLRQIISGIEQSNAIVGDIARYSRDQHEAIAEVQEGVGQISDVAQQNSATAEESAAASQEMNAQSKLLEQAVNHFRY